LLIKSLFEKGGKGDLGGFKNRNLKEFMANALAGATDTKRQSWPQIPAAARIAFTLRPKPNIIQGKIA
jgi:hypothetical protein